MPLIVSLFGESNPEYILFIEGDDLYYNNKNELLKWINNAYAIIKNNKYDYIFGNSQIINNKKIGCSILLSKASIIQHLLYNTDSDTTHINPFIQLSLATETTFNFIPYKYIKESNLQNIKGKFSLNMNCPLINDNTQPTLCIMLPAFKRNYFSLSVPAFANQTYKPKFYIFIQNSNKEHFNMSYIQSMVNETIFHIWIQNWNSFFFLNHRLASVFPCDLILKYDDDQWPIDNNLQKNLIEKIKNKNIIIGAGGETISKSYYGYTPGKFKMQNHHVKDHVATPFLFRTSYLKLDARNHIFRIYGGEDISLSLNSNKLCGVSSIKENMNIIQKHNDGYTQRNDNEIILEYKKENNTHFSLFTSSYCYLIKSGYIPISWQNFQIPKNDFINITLEHKRIF